MQLGNCAIFQSKTLRLFQDGDLSCVVKLVLRDAVQQMVEIVFLAGDAIAKAGLGQGRNRLHQRIVRALGVSNGLAPCGFGRFGNNREIRVAGELDSFAGDAAEGCAIPRGYVKHELPDAVNRGHRLGCSARSIHILQKFEEGWTVPGISCEGTAQLVGNQDGFRDRGGHAFNFTPPKILVNIFTHTRDSCIIIEMIVSFGDKTTEDIFHGQDTKAARRIAQVLWTRVQAKLDLLNASTTLEDLRVPPSNRLEKLRGGGQGFAACG